ncbi:unnamed protein product [Orchesella dallaii]|uniref:Cytochrome P450 n=1 Tax=Orchesella dallaii TaxID=48710 RepID=A0ABP1S0G7_9HEXA
MVLEMLTGSDIKQDDKEIVEYHHNFQKWKDSLLERINTPWCMFDFPWKFYKMYHNHNEIVSNMNGFAKRRLEELMVKEKSNNKPKTEGKFISFLEELSNVGLSKQELLDEIHAVLFGGFETTATTTHFFCFMMALYPEYQELCRKEIDEVFSDPLLTHDGTLTYDAVSSLKFVEQCLLETLRLYPPAFMLMRNLKKNFIFDYEGKNVNVPSGTHIIIGAYAIQRSEKYYPNPEVFNPDRFLPEECAKRNPYTYLSFSAGPRNCVGYKFSMNELKTIVAYMLRKFEITTTDKLNDVTLLPNITLTPERGYNFLFKKRKF